MAPRGPNKLGVDTRRGQKSTGRETVVMKQEFISVRLTPGRQWTSVSNTVSRSAGSTSRFIEGTKESVGQRRMGLCRWAMKVKSIIVLRSVPLGLTGSGLSLLLQGGMSFPIGVGLSTGSFA